MIELRRSNEVFQWYTKIRHRCVIGLIVIGVVLTYLYFYNVANKA